ncbi:MAG: STAS domain-containing protein [Methanolinea sp.]|nr:STAS domain-containing protein [Methanolinea sp.]
MSTVLEVTEHRQGPADLLLLKGRMDAATSPGAESHLNRLIDGGSRNIIIDCSDLVYISSAGLRVLLAALKRLKQCGGRLSLASLQPETRKVFEIAGFHRLFAIFPGVNQAIDSIERSTGS